MTEPRITCWGTRGSIASPGPATAHYGGNTCCVEIEVGGRSLVFDAGTGIRLLGRQLVERSGSLATDVFLTHFHWDHIQGFPFFAPLYQEGASFRIMGPRQADAEIQTLFAGQMGPVYFPVPFEAIAARIDFAHLNDGTWHDGEFEVRAMRVRHPSFTVGYRINAGGRSICYVPDNELEGAKYAVDGGDWRKRFLQFVAGADLLLHDAMFTDAEYTKRIGWGHSTFRQVLDLAVESGVKRLCFFHHAPERTDAELRAIVDETRAEVERRCLPLAVDAAAEGNPITLEAGHP
ncbi:MAG: MBL fold metallo-hydrolase [Gemmatimonadetes bacterium]|nr:MBL fold metallo-hydrolase [Gemmatimonadota bacterium]